jgi:hypothetical protein
VRGGADHDGGGGVRIGLALAWLGRAALLAGTGKREASSFSDRYLDIRLEKLDENLLEPTRKV